MSESIKAQIHQMIDQCDNMLLLEEIKLLLQSGKDWCDNLPDEDKNLVYGVRSPIRIREWSFYQS
jgi:hypothetical protein